MSGAVTGTRIMKRTAVPMVRGLVSPTILTPVIISVACLLSRWLLMRRELVDAETASER